MLKTTTYGPITRFDLARTLAGQGRYWTTCYLVDGMLIDTGCAHAAHELEQALAGISLQRIVNTHTHEDHIGANGRLQRERGLEVLAHPLSLPILADPHSRQPLHPYRRLFWGWPEPSRASPLNDDQVIETPSSRFQVIYTPGHAADHLCLWEPERCWLFSGDLYVGGRDRAVRRGTDLWQAIDSLKRIAALPVEWLFPGSARARQHPAGDLKMKIDYLEGLGERVLKLYHQGHNIPEISRLVYDGPMWIEIVTLGHFTRQHLVRSYLGHYTADTRVPSSS